MTESRRDDGQDGNAGDSIWTTAGKILSGAALLLTIIGVVAVIGGGALYLWVEELRGFASTLMIVGLGILLAALISSFVTVKKALTGQRGRYALNALVIILVGLTIIILLNFISYDNSIRTDTTATRHFSLSQQTIDLLRELPGPIEATAFFTPSRTNLEAATRQRAEDLLSEYQRRSNRSFTYEFVDPELDPSTANQYNVSRYPTIVFEAIESGKRYNLPVPPLTEQDLTSSILVVTGAEQKRIYFLTGHREKSIADLDETSTSSYGLAVRGLLADSYGISTLNLSEFRDGEALPDDIAALIIAGPQTGLEYGQTDQLVNWLKDGGRALFLLDPKSGHGFKEVLSRWGLFVNTSTIIDEGISLYGDPRTPLLQPGQYPAGSPITRDLDATLFPGATSVQINMEPEKVPPWIQYAPLARSSLLSCSTMDLERDTCDREKDESGPHFLAMWLQATSTVDEEPTSQSGEPKITSIIVFTDSEFASNRYYTYSTNKDFFLNAVNSLTQDFDLISIRPRPFALRHLVMTSQEFDFIRYSSWFLLPLAVASISLLVWWRRR